MPRALLSAVMFAFVLFAGTAQAQRGGGGGAFPRGSAPVGIVGHPGPRNDGFAGRPHFRHSPNFGSVFLPFWYDEPFGYDQSDVEAAMNPLAPPVIILQPDDRQSQVPEVSSATPKLIEIPGVASPTFKAQSPAVFVLANGQQLESGRYMLTAENLSVTIERQQRIIPISMLDLNATVAANRERGIELRIPADRNEISLSF